MLDFDALRPLYEEKMKMVEDQIGTHPKMKMLMAGGPEFSNWAYEAMFAVFCAGAETMMKGIKTEN